MGVALRPRRPVAISSSGRAARRCTHYRYNTAQNSLAHPNYAKGAHTQVIGATVIVRPFPWPAAKHRVPTNQNTNATMSASLASVQPRWAASATSAFALLRRWTAEPLSQPVVRALPTAHLALRVECSDAPSAMSAGAPEVSLPPSPSPHCATPPLPPRDTSSGAMPAPVADAAATTNGTAPAAAAVAGVKRRRKHSMAPADATRDTAAAATSGFWPTGLGTSSLTLNSI